MKRVLFALLALAAGVCMAQDRPTLERRAQSIGTNARLMHREAGALVQVGDLAGAARLLDQAAREMMDGARLARPEQVTGEKARRDFDARLDSARALLVAQQRITQEKTAARTAPPEAVQATRGIEADIAAAEQLAREGRLDEGRARLDRAYLTARVSIESMRRGDTLVRSLHFASPREEFDYEVDRNDTHRMLIKVLLADRKDASGAMPPAMQPFIDKADLLRQQADVLARRGEHAGAVKVLEDATRELVRAIRAGGVYIPG